MADISKININGTLYDIKDTVARQSLVNSGGWIISSNAGDTPYGVTWNNGSTTITGTLTPGAADHKKFYLVPTTSQSGAATGDVFDEWVAVPESTGATTYKWEKLGSTQFNGVVTTSSAQAITALTTSTHHHTVTVPSVKIKGTVSENHSHTASLTKNKLYVDTSSNVIYTTSYSSQLTGSGTTTSSGEHTHNITFASNASGGIPFIKTASDKLHTHTIQNASVSFVVGTATNASYPVVTTGTYNTSSIASQSITIGATSDNALTSITASTKYLATTHISNITGGSVNIPTGSNIQYATVSVLTGIAASINAVKGVSASTVVTGVSGSIQEVLTDISGKYDKLSISGTSTNGASKVISNLTSASLQKVSVITSVSGTFLTGYSNSNKPAYTASVDTASETLILNSITFASTNVSVDSHEYGINGDVYTYTASNLYISASTASVSIASTKQKFTTTKVNSASAPENIDISFTSGSTTVISSSKTYTEGAGIMIGSFGGSSYININFTSNPFDVILASFTTSRSSIPIITEITSASKPFISGINNINIPEHRHTVELTGNNLSAFIASSNFSVNNASTGISFVDGTLGATIGSSGAHTHTISDITVGSHNHNILLPFPVIAATNEIGDRIQTVDYITGITLSSSGSGANVTINSSDTGYAVGAAGDITTTESGQLVTGASTWKDFITSVTFS